MISRVASALRSRGKSSLIVTSLPHSKTRSVRVWFRAAIQSASPADKMPLTIAHGGEKDTRHKQNSEWAGAIGLREKILRRGLQFFSRHSASVSESNYGSPDCPIEALRPRQT
jgi:hypothetical protein